MKKFFLLLMLTINFQLIYSQADTTNILLNKFVIKTLKGREKIFEKAVILNNSFQYVREAYIYLNIDSFVYSYSPSKSEILEAELLFYTKYNLVMMSSNKVVGFELKPKVRKYFLKHYRQYIGLINSKNEKLIFVQFLNFKNKRKAKKYFKYWDKTLVNGTGSFYEENTQTYIINITQNILYRY